MDKIAQLKHAEVAGVISGLIDGGYLKLASDQEFEALTEAVAGSISNNWDLGEVLDKTAEIMDGGMDKTAEEQMHDALADYGYLVLMKEAEEISDEEFIAKVAEWKGTATEWMGNLLGRANKAGGELIGKAGKPLAKAISKKREFVDALSFKKTRDLYNKIKGMKDAAKSYGAYADDWKIPGAMDLLKSTKGSAKAWGGVAGTGAGLYGLNKLRDADTRDAIAKKFNAGKKAILG